MQTTNEIEKKAKQSDGIILKTDIRGYVRIPKEKREEIMCEYERSGMCAAEFAKWTGIKYTTFCNWVQERRRKPREVKTGRKVKWLEAVVDHGSKSTGRIVMHLGLVRVEVADAKVAVQMMKELGVRAC